MKSAFKPEIKELRSNTAVFIAFNEPFIKYAGAFISSFHRHNPKIDVVCFTVNIDLKKLRALQYPWNSDRVVLYSTNYDFDNPLEERCFMNSKRFELFLTHLQDYKFVYMSDADTMCTGKINEIYQVMEDSDIGFIYTYNKDLRKSLRACTIPVNVNENSVTFFEEYVKNLDLIYGNNEWYNDQITLYKVIEERKAPYRICELNTHRLCAFRKEENGLFVATCQEEKLRGNYYHTLFDKEQKIIQRRIKKEKLNYAVQY